MKNNPTPTLRQFAIFAFFTLTNAAGAWSWVLKGMVSKEAKHRLNVFHTAEKALAACFERDLGIDVIQAYSEDAAIWNEIMTILQKGSVEDKARFVSFLKAYQNNEVKEVFPETAA